MSHLVKIFDECEKIADLKKKIQVDPSRTREYEAQVWKHSTRLRQLIGIESLAETASPTASALVGDWTWASPRTVRYKSLHFLWTVTCAKRWLATHVGL